LTSFSAGIETTGAGSLTVINTAFLNNTVNYAGGSYGGPSTQAAAP
jgi:hypothetical protein